MRGKPARSSDIKVLTLMMEHLMIKKEEEMTTMQMQPLQILMMC